MAASRSPLPRTVLVLGLVSLLTDAGSELIFPFLPVFLTEQLGAQPAFLGLVEGAADMVASLLKLATGWVIDRFPRRKWLVVAGYGLAGAVRPLVALATRPWHVLAVRVTDRVGKGIRSTPRDALLADAAPPGEAGRAFGFHRAMDHAGAVVGPVVGSLLVALGLHLRTIFALAAIPGALAFVAVLLVREEPRASFPSSEAPAAVALRAPLPTSLKSYLAILTLFSLGNSSDAFLLLRAKELGVATALMPLLWAALHVSKLTSSWLFGSLSDRLPRTRLITAGWMLYALVYLGFGAAQRTWQAWALFLVYGVFYGLCEPAEKALVRDVVPAAGRGRAFGLYNFLVGVSALPAGLLTGFLWKHFGAFTALAAGAALAGGASVLLAIWTARVRPQRS